MATYETRSEWEAAQGGSIWTSVWESSDADGAIELISPGSGDWNGQTWTLDNSGVALSADFNANGEYVIAPDTGGDFYNTVHSATRLRINIATLDPTATALDQFVFQIRASVTALNGNYSGAYFGFCNSADYDENLTAMGWSGGAGGMGMYSRTDDSLSNTKSSAIGVVTDLELLEVTNGPGPFWRHDYKASSTPGDPWPDPWSDSYAGGGSLKLIHAQSPDTWPIPIANLQLFINAYRTSVSADAFTLTVHEARLLKRNS